MSSIRMEQDAFAVVVLLHTGAQAPPRKTAPVLIDADERLAQRLVDHVQAQVGTVYDDHAEHDEVSPSALTWEKLQGDEDKLEGPPAHGWAAVSVKASGVQVRLQHRCDEEQPGGGLVLATDELMPCELHKSAEPDSPELSWNIMCKATQRNAKFNAGSRAAVKAHKERIRRLRNRAGAAGKRRRRRAAWTDSQFEEEAILRNYVKASRSAAGADAAGNEDADAEVTQRVE